MGLFILLASPNVGFLLALRAELPADPERAEERSAGDA